MYDATIFSIYPQPKFKLFLSIIGIMGAWLLALILLGIVIIWSFRRVAQKLFLKGRELKLLAEIHAKVQDQVSADVFNKVWSKVGEAFTIDPRLINPDDTLKRLFDIDSWDFGEGEDDLGQWIESECFGRPSTTLITVLDLAKWVQANRISKTH